jgi:hypothetical protein
MFRMVESKSDTVIEPHAGRHQPCGLLTGYHLGRRTSRSCSHAGSPPNLPAPLSELRRGRSRKERQRTPPGPTPPQTFRHTQGTPPLGATIIALGSTRRKGRFGNSDPGNRCPDQVSTHGSITRVTRIGKRSARDAHRHTIPPKLLIQLNRHPPRHLAHLEILGRPVPLHPRRTHPREPGSLIALSSCLATQRFPLLPADPQNPKK